MRPQVSVIIPTYNQADQLKEALCSVIGQTVTNWEAWVVNNSSRDGTVGVIQEMSDPRIRRVDISNRGIIARSRNEGIRRAIGEYVAFMDSDDVWLPKKLERVLDVFKRNPDIEVVCHWERIRKNGRLMGTYRYGPESKAEHRQLLFSGNQLSTSAVTIKRNCLRRVRGFNVDASLVTAEDYDLWLALSHLGCRMYFLPEALGEYRITGHNMSANTDLHHAAVRKVVLRHYRQLHERSVKDFFLLCRRLAKIEYTRARDKISRIVARTPTAGSLHDRWPSDLPLRQSSFFLGK